MRSFRERVLVFLCHNRVIVLLVFVFSFVAFLFTLFSLALLERNSGPFVVAVLNLLGLVFLMGWSGYVSWKCHSQIPAPPE